MSLTAPERETVITFSDEDDTATVHTHQISTFSSDVAHKVSRCWAFQS